MTSLVFANVAKSITTTLSVDVIEGGNSTPLGYYNEIDNATTNSSNTLKCTLTFANPGTRTGIRGELQYSFDEFVWNTLSNYDYGLNDFTYPTLRSGTVSNSKIITIPLNLSVTTFNSLHLRAVSNAYSTSSSDLVATATSNKGCIVHIAPQITFEAGTVDISNSSFSIPLNATWNSYGYGYYNGTVHSGTLPAGYTCTPQIRVKDASNNTIISTFTTFSDLYTVSTSDTFNRDFINLIIEGETVVACGTGEIKNTKQFSYTITALAVQPLVSYQKQKLGINTNSLSDTDLLRIFSPNDNIITLITPRGSATIDLEDFSLNNFIIDGGTW